MRRRLVVLLVAAVVAGVFASTAVADPPQNNGHNCAGFTSSFVPEENLGESVRAIAGAAPTAIPGTLDFANCGGNGFPPG
jgi:hypothetical protein